MAAICFSLVSVFIFSLISGYSNALSVDYYHQTCPKAESTIRKAVKKAMMNDNTVPAALLRMHFHDCFIRVQFSNMTFTNNFFVRFSVFFNFHYDFHRVYLYIF